MTALPEPRTERLNEIEDACLDAEALADRLEKIGLYKAAAYVSMGLDAIREARNRLSASG